LPELRKYPLANPHFDPEGHHAGHAKLLYGLLCKAKKRRALALQHLTDAKPAHRTVAWDIAFGW
jgi:hypothetical protein